MCYVGMTAVLCPPPGPSRWQVFLCSSGKRRMNPPPWAVDPLVQPRPQAAEGWGVDRPLGRAGGQLSRRRSAAPGHSRLQTPREQSSALPWGPAAPGPPCPVSDTQCPPAVQGRAPQHPVSAPPPHINNVESLGHTGPQAGHFIHCEFCLHNHSLTGQNELHQFSTVPKVTQLIKWQS